MQYAHNDDEDDGKEESAERVNAKEWSRKSIRINKPRTNRAGVCRRVVVAVVAGTATVCNDARSPSAYVATSQSLPMAAEAELSRALAVRQKFILFANDSGKKKKYNNNKMCKQMQATKLLANKSLLLLLWCRFSADEIDLKWNTTLRLISPQDRCCQ